MDGMIQRLMIDADSAMASSAGPMPPSSAAATKPAETPGSQADAEEAFIAPALADIDAQANWIDQPVANLLEVRRKEEQGTNPPVTASEALAQSLLASNPSAPTGHEAAG